jgi:UDP-N-acetylglucosamine 3-dehydrogenase
MEIAQERASMIRVGVIGVGNMGRHHARVYSEIATVQLCAVADFDESRARAVAVTYGCRAYRDYREMLAQERLDAVSIAVPTCDHFAVGCAVIEAGLNLLVEKPISATLAEAEALVEKAKASNLKLAVGHIERFNPAVRELKRRVDLGTLGEISSVVAKRVGVMPPRVKDANVIIDLAVHDIDILNYLFGATPLELTATAGRALLSDRYDHAEIFLRYSTDHGGKRSSAGCFVQVNWITPLKIRTLSVTGDLGHAELNYMTQRLEVYQTNAAKEYNDFGEFVVRFGEAEKSVVPIQVREPLTAELEDFVDAVEKGRPPKVSGEDGVRALRVAEKAISSLKA